MKDYCVLLAVCFILTLGTKAAVLLVETEDPSMKAGTSIHCTFVLVKNIATVLRRFRENSKKILKHIES